MKWYRRLSFKARAFLGCLLVALMPLTFSSVVMMHLLTTPINRQITMDGNQQLEKIRERFIQLLENCQKACKTLTKNGPTAWVMISNKTIESQKDLYSSMYQVAQEIYSHAQLCIYGAGGKLRFTTGTTLKDSRLPMNWGLLNKASEEQGITYYKTDPCLPSSDSDVLTQGAFSLESTHGARTGYVVLDFTRENFDNLLNDFYSSGNALLVLDSHQKPLYCSRPEYGERRISDIVGHTTSGQGGAEKRGVYTEYLWTEGSSQGFYILLCCSASISAPTVHTMGTASLTLSGLGLVFCLLIAGALSRSIGQPVSLLGKTTAKVKKRDLSVRIRTNRQDELGRLTESFSQTTGDLQKCLDDTVQKQRDLDKTILRLYQTQLNPHFFYNILDSIEWNTRINQVPEVTVLAENLTVILRKNISSRPFITPREKLETIENYMEIQKIRFTRRFLYKTEIPDQLEDCMVPRMILQPLIGNAIIHGLNGCGHGCICIYTFQKEGILNISVTDDGCGMSRGVADWISSGAPAKRDGHPGLCNVINILKIYYGQEYGVEAAATEGGTTITLRLPAQKEVPDV